MRIRVLDAEGNPVGGARVQARLVDPEGRTVKEVASELGFRNLQRFSAWFKAMEGVAPRKFRSGEFTDQR